MAHVALYREWRPLTFDEVVEQSHVVTALRQTVVTGQIAHAYLFSGTRGTGKTTVAKIFSRAINCLSPKDGNPCNQCEICTGILNGSLLDVVEMDAASNNSVDTIRRIVDEVVFMPSQARFKVYIVDEVHMLSTGAFNALLKTLEEPPAHAVFILATTEPYRIPATILSRCQRYEFRRIPLRSLVARLREIADAGGIAVEAEALDAIGRLAEGGMRDAISLLDQVRMTVAPGHAVDRDDVLRMTGVADDDLMAQVGKALLTGNAPSLLEAIGQLVMTGRDPARFLIDLAAYCRNLLVVAVTAEPSELLQVTRDQLQRLQTIARLTDSATLVTLVRELSALHGELRWSSDSRTTLEVGLLRLMTVLPATCALPSAGAGAGAGAAQAGSTQTAVPAFSAPVAVASVRIVAPAAAAPTAVPTTVPAVVAPAAAVPAAAAPIAVPAVAVSAALADIASAPVGMPFLNDVVRKESVDLTGLEAPPLPEPPPEDPTGYEPLPQAELPRALPRTGETSRNSATPIAMRTAAPAPVSAMPTPRTAAPAPVTAPISAGARADIFAPPATDLATAVPLPVQAADAPAAFAAEEAAASQFAPTTGDLFSPPPNPSAAPDDRARWQAIQDQLICDGQMTLYLFSRPAAFSFCGGELHLLFSEKDKVNCQDLKEMQNIKALRSAATRVIGTDTPVVVRLAADPEAEALQCPVPSEPVWITRVREAADAFGIPMKVEEN